MSPKKYCQNHRKTEAASVCRYCGKWFCEECIPLEKGIYHCDKPSCVRAFQKENSLLATTATAESLSIEGKYLYISNLRLALMNIFTLNLYSCYWFYMNWKYVKDRDRTDISPFWRCFFSPFYCHSFFKQVRNDDEMNNIKKATFNASAWATGWVVLMLTANLLRSLNKIAGPWPYTGLLRLCIHLSLFLFLLPVQGYINQVNEFLDPKPAFHRWSLGQALFLIVGLLAFIGILTEAVEGK